ncbi:MAG: alpha/beta hydrolase fold domain-containing protein [Acidimicrobiales bacterium]
MQTRHPMPPLDPEAGPLWRKVAERMYGGAGPVVDAGTLAEVRALELVTRQSLLQERPYQETLLEIPGPAGTMALSVFTHEAAQPGAPGLFWIHGGGMVMGTRYGVPEALDAMEPFGAVVASLEYRLAPEHPAPAPGDDCFAGMRWFAEHAAELGVDRHRILLGGTSAGGGLAAATALRIRDEGGPGLAGLLLLCPMLDDRMRTLSADQCADTLPWTRASNEFGWRALLGERAGTDDVTIYEAPGRATDLAGLPPTYVDVGSADMFRDEDVAFASGTWASGGDAELHVWAGGFHGFDLIVPHGTLAGDVLAARRRWLARKLGTGPG